jgi:hypothetical protein
MVKSLVSRFVSSTALVCLAWAALMSAASAQTTTTDMHFTTAITQVYGSQYPITGRLDIQIFPAGNLRDGSYVWFDIGPSSIDLGLGAGPDGKLHVVGTLGSDGSFRGQVYPETTAVLSGPSMTNQFPNPTATSNQQYIFAATPTNEPTPTVSGPP